MNRSKDSGATAKPVLPLIALVLVVVVAAALVLRSGRKNATDGDRHLTVSDVGPTAVADNKPVNAAVAIPPVSTESAPKTSGAESDRYLKIIEGRYGPVLASFNIPPEQLVKLKRLLADRRAALNDLSELRGSEDPEVAKGAAAVTRSGKIDSDFRREMKAVLRADDWLSVSRMLDIEQTLFSLEHTYASELNKIGAPLSGAQLFFVADTTDRFYGSGIGDPAQYVSTIDANSHLTVTDQSFLEKLSGTLSPAQIQAMRAHIIAKNERIQRVAALPNAK